MEEIAKKNEEVKRLKALKMREIRQKLNLVSKESGFAEDGAIPLLFRSEWGYSHDRHYLNHRIARVRSRGRVGS